MSGEAQEVAPPEGSGQHEHDDHQGHDHQGRVAVPVRFGLAEERAVEVELGKSVMALLEAIAADRAWRTEELILVREDEDEPLAAVVLIDTDYPYHRRHHVHHRSEVKVTVFYQATSHERPFKRWATVEDILVWAVRAFGIDPSMATEFELARHGQTEELPGSEHIGHLAGRCDVLALDLVRGDIANGHRR